MQISILCKKRAVAISLRDIFCDFLQKLCNDKGVCLCGECICTAEDGYYKGPTCEDCPVCTRFSSTRRGLKRLEAESCNFQTGSCKSPTDRCG